uniref:Putative zinc finger MYM-type protein 1-like n=1 Tax=Davidia involucrata TaxID=16924 RepID=A0A5B7B014_DAVIN
MEKFLKRKSTISQDSSPTQESRSGDHSQQSSKQSRVDLKDLPADPGLRQKISYYHPNDQDEIRRAYLQKGPCQPYHHKFSQRNIGGVMRRFNPFWFEKYGNWLEYSIEKDAAFCLCCYLFTSDIGKQAGSDSFVSGGFTAWNKKERLEVHVGGPNSAHNQAWNKCQDLMKQKQHIQVALCKQPEQARSEYRTILTASIDCIRFLLRQGLSFHGHDETEDSSNRGNFLELLQFLADHNETISNVVLRNPLKNLKFVTPDIQKDIVNAAANETTNAIIEDLGDDLFAILVDESCDVSSKEQMTVVLRYVDKRGIVLERFLGIVHVIDTTALSRKATIESLFSKHGLSSSRIRGQSYDGASNMQGEFNGLKTLIMKENELAFYIHCFAHQLQLTLIIVAKNHVDIAWFFNLVSTLLNVVGASCKCQDILQEKQAAKVVEALSNGELQSGRELNQETSLKRAADTRWGSHYGTLLNLAVIFSSVIDVLEFIEEDGLDSEQRAEACVLMDSLQSFDFAFNLHLMKTVLGITNELSLALQRKDQDIVNAMTLVEVSKQQLQMMRDKGWEPLLNEVSSFCNKHGISIPNIDDIFVVGGRSRHKAPQITNLHHYRVELFYTVVDMQLQELNNRFNEVNTELLICVACLNPSDSFSAFNKQRLVRFAQFYPCEFSAVDLLALENQLENYIIDMRSNKEFCEVKGISDLARKLVETKKNIVYPLIYLLLKLALILPVATATVEREFSVMKLIKNRLCDRMGDQLMNDCLVTYIEKDVFDGISNDAIIQRFQNMKNRREEF